MTTLEFILITSYAISAGVIVYLGFIRIPGYRAALRWKISEIKMLRQMLTASNAIGSTPLVYLDEFVEWEIEMKRGYNNLLPKLKKDHFFQLDDIVRYKIFLKLKEIQNEQHKNA